MNTMHRSSEFLTLVSASLLTLCVFGCATIGEEQEESALDEVIPCETCEDLDDPHRASTCDEPNRTIREVVNGMVICRCDAGHIEDAHGNCVLEEEEEEEGDFEITSSADGEPVAYGELATLSVSPTDPDHCFAWYAGVGMEAWELEETSSSMSLRVFYDETYLVEVYESDCETLIGQASTRLTLIPSELGISNISSHFHASVGESVSFEAVSYSGTVQVPATEVYDAQEMVWLVILDGETEPLLTDESGPVLNLSFDEVGGYWVHFRFLDVEGRYGYSSSFVTIR